MSRVVVFDEFGGPDVLHIVDDALAEPASGEVRVKMEAFALNPLDALMRAGTAPAPVALPHARLGIEGTGIVDALGPDVVGLKVGDPVMFAAVPDATVRGTYAESTTAPVDRVIRRPAGLEISEAASVWVAFSTAYGALVEKAKMRPGDHVVITAASGGVGRAAIQVANQIGAIPVAVTRHAAKRDDLLAAGAAAVVVTDDEDLVKSIDRHTNGAGADVILDLVLGPGLPDLARTARLGATLVIPAPFPSAVPLTIHRYRSFEHSLDPAAVKRMAAFLQAGLRLGALRPAVDTVFAFDDVVEAHRRLDDGRHGGKKIVVSL